MTDQTEFEGRLLVSEEAQFNELLDIIHDEFFELDEIRHDSFLNSVEIPYRRVFHSYPRRLLKNRWIYRVEEVDVLRSVLRIRSVESMEIMDKAEIGSYSFNDMAYDEARHELLFRCEPACEILFRVSNIDIESKGIGFRGKARITSGFWGDAGPSRVYC